MHFLHFLDMTLSRNLTFLAFTTTPLVPSFVSGYPSSSHTVSTFVFTLFIIDSKVFLSSSLITLDVVFP